MIIFWIILIWSGIFSFIFSLLNKKKKVTNKGIFWMILFTFLALIFFAACRSVVSDTQAYANFYNQIPNELSKFNEYISNMKKDTVFWGLSMIFKCLISSNYHIWFFAITLICCSLFASTITKYSEMPFLSSFMFILTCDFCWLFNGMRQFLAVCLVFFAFKYIEKKDFKKFLLYVIIASTMHLTALFAIPIFYIARTTNNNKKMYISVITLLIILANLSTLLPTIDSLLVGTEYRDVINQFSHDDGVNVIRVLISLVPIMLFNIFKKNYVGEIPEHIKVVYNLCIFNVLIVIVGVFTSGIYIGRMSIYFDLFTLLLYPWIFKNLLNRNSRKIILPIYISLYFVFYYYQMVITWDGFGYVSDVLNLYIR